MTKNEILELLETERECVMRNSANICERYCLHCDLLREDTDIIMMYNEVIEFVRALAKHEKRGQIK